MPVQQRRRKDEDDDATLFNPEQREIHGYGKLYPTLKTQGIGERPYAGYVELSPSPRNDVRLLVEHRKRKEKKILLWSGRGTRPSRIAHV